MKTLEGLLLHFNKAEDLLWKTKSRSSITVPPCVLLAGHTIPHYSPPAVISRLPDGAAVCGGERRPSPRGSAAEPSPLGGSFLPDAATRLQNQEDLATQRPAADASPGAAEHN